MKIKTLISTLIIASASTSMTSCSTSESAFNDLQNFSTQIETRGQYYDAHDWKKVVKKFGKIRKNISKHEYTVAERTRIGKLEGKVVKDMAKGMKDGVTNHILGIASEIQGIMDELGFGK